MCVFLLAQLLNDITLQPTATTELEQVVELSILLSGEMFSDELNDPASLQFQTLRRDVAEKVCLQSISVNILSLYTSP